MKYVIITIISILLSGCATTQQIQSNIQNNSQEDDKNVASAINIIGELIIYSISK